MKCDTGELDEKCHYANEILFELTCCFIVMLFYNERKQLLMRDLSTVLPLKPNLPGKFQRFSAIDGSIEILKHN